MTDRKTVNIIGYDVVLRRRFTKDVNDLGDWVRANNDGSPLFSFYVAAIVVSASLKRSRASLKWYQFKSRRIYKKLINPKTLMNRLDVIELNFLQVIVLTLEKQFNLNLDALTIENFDLEKLAEETKKKVQENRSGDSEQKL